MNENAEKLFKIAQEQLSNEYNQFMLFYIREKDTPIGTFLTKVLEWKTDRTKSQWLWEMFNKAFDGDGDLHFFGKLRSFAINCFLDDSYFIIRWEKFYFDEEGDLKNLLSTKEDPLSKPVIYWDGDGSQDPNLLIEVMNIKEVRELQRIKEIEEEMNNG